MWTTKIVRKYRNKVRRNQVAVLTIYSARTKLLRRFTRFSASSNSLSIYPRERTRSIRNNICLDDSTTRFAFSDQVNIGRVPKCPSFNGRSHGDPIRPFYYSHALQVRRRYDSIRAPLLSSTVFRYAIVSRKRNVGFPVPVNYAAKRTGIISIPSKNEKPNTRYMDDIRPDETFLNVPIHVDRI